MFGSNRVEVFAIPGGVVVGYRLVVTKSLGCCGIVDAPIRVNLAEGAIASHRLERGIDLMKQFLIVLPNTDAESHSCRNFEIPDLGPGRVIRGDRRIHDDSVQASKGQIDELLNLPVVASNRNVSEALDITFRERYPQYTGCEAAQVIGPMNSCVIRAYR